MEVKAILKPHEFAELIGVSVKSLHRWDKSGKLKAHRTPVGHRFYTREQYEEYMRKSAE